MHRTNVFRYTAIGVLESRLFRAINLTCTMMTIVCLLLEDPLDTEILNPHFPQRRTPYVCVRERESARACAQLRERESE